MPRALTAISTIPLPVGTIDEVGHAYGCLTVREYSGIAPGGGALWLCDCACGQEACRRETKVRAAKLRSGAIISCGALRGNFGIRQAARLKVSPRRRKQIARMGADARRK